MQQHRDTVMPGRTWLQQGPPVTLGLKCTGWLDAFQRHRERLQQLQQRVFTLHFGGVVGTLGKIGRDASLLMQTDALRWIGTRTASSPSQC